MWVSRVLLLIAFALLLRKAFAQTGSSPPPKTIVDDVKERTFQHHTGREASAVVDNSTDASQDSAPLNFVPVGAPTAGGPSPAAELVISHTGQNTSEEVNQATPAPMQNDVIIVNGDPVVVPKTSQSSNREGWAVPAAIVLLLVIAAGVGFFVVYRRRRASRYHGLSETELGQVHRSI